MDPNQAMPTQYDTGMPPGPYQAIKTSMVANLSVFREPRGVMRILQFIFAICAFATTTGYTGFIELVVKKCLPGTLKFYYSYPFKLDHQTMECNLTDTLTMHKIKLIGDFSSDAQFFVATGVLSFLYCIGIVVVYIMFDAMYQSNGTLPLADFILTVTLAVFWLSGSAAWANGLTGLKWATQAVQGSKSCTLNGELLCETQNIGSYSGLNISVILGFLNFFLWASDLWFLYKETPWFKLKQGSAGVGTVA